MSKGPGKQENQAVSEQLEVLTRKIEAMDEKLNKVEQSSNTALNYTQTLLNGNDIQRVNLIVSNNVADPNGFIAREITNQLIIVMQKYQTTEFRRWLVVRGRNIVEQSISSFVSQTLPQLKWYGVHISKIDENNYHQTAKTTFPVQIKTGIPIISTITIAKVNFEFDSDVDVVNGKMSNTRSSLKTGDEEKQVFKSFIEDLDQSLKPHKRVYAIAHPIGVGITKVYHLFMKETNFSVPFIVTLLLTLLYPAFFPAALIYFGLLRLSPIWLWFLGISIQNLLLGVLNGAIWGALVWISIKYNLLEKAKVFGILTKINKPGGPQIDLRIAAGAGLVVVVLIAGGWWLISPKTGDVDVTAVRSYADPNGAAMLKALDSGSYSSIVGILDGPAKAILTEPGFAGYSLYVKRDYGIYNTTVFWKASEASGAVKAYYNATYSGIQGYFPVIFTFTSNGGYHYLSSVEFQAPNRSLKVP
jgi:hypothetical protein